ncbi:MAG: IS200/IS605 family transposase [Bacteroidota bacterium]
MSSTYSKMYAQLVFAVKGRQSLIHCPWEEELYKYITGIIQTKKQKMLAINGMPDHLHIFIGMKPACCLSDLVMEIKKSSHSFIKEKGFAKQFSWQDGFGAFTYGHSQIDQVVKYVMNQKQRHQKHTFRQEYISLLKKFEIEFEEKYLFEFIDPADLHATPLGS